MRRTIASTVLLAAVLGPALPVAARSTDDPISFVCYGEHESEKGTYHVYYASTLSADGTCTAQMSYTSISPELAAPPEEPISAVSCSWEPTGEMGPHSGRVEIDWGSLATRTSIYRYLWISSKKLLISQLQSSTGVRAAGNRFCERQTFDGNLFGKGQAFK